MSYQEKRTVANIIAGALVLAAYCIYVLGKFQAGAVGAYDLKFFAGAMLKFIGIGIVATIIIQIVFHIVLAVSVAIKEKCCDENKINRSIESVEDEMDKLIEMKSKSIGFVIFGIGFVAALVSLVLDFPPTVMLNIIFLSCSLGSLLEGFLSLHYYKKGIKNG